MRELLDDVDRWRAAGRRVALARVVDLTGSGPRGPGAAMAVSEDGEVSGSVSGGCIEGALVETALGALGSGKHGLHSFGYSDDDAFAVGLTCGGTIRVLVGPLDPLHDALAAAVRAGTPAALATVVEGASAGASLLVRPGAEPLGSLGHADLDRVVARDAAGELAAGSTRVRHYGSRGQAGEQDVAVFVESFSPPPRMLVLGAVDFAAALSRVAAVLGYRVTVCDARATFATAARFPAASEVLVGWPHRLLERVGPELTARDAVCVLTHEARFDVPAVAAALATGAGYVGAMGSRRTHEERLRRLRAAGVGEESLARLHSPIGLDLGARSPEETAVSICAEIIAVRTGRSGAAAQLRSGSGPIH